MDVKVPYAVINKFKTLFPNIDSVKWEKRDWTSFSSKSYSANLNYSAEFKVNNQYSWAKFDSTGEKMHVHIDLSYDSLPVNTKHYLSKKYKKHLPNEKYYELERKERRYYRWVAFSECMIIDNWTTIFSLRMSHYSRLKVLRKEYTFVFDADGKFMERHIYHNF